VLTWLAAFFGPALRMTSFASCLIPDKGIAVDSMAPDFTVGCIEYGGGVVARVTCGLVAPHDKSLTIIGDDGVMSVSNVRNDMAPVRIRAIPPRGWRARLERQVEKTRKTLKLSGGEQDWHVWSTYPMPGRLPGRFVSDEKPVDFCRGPAELADAILQKRPCRLSAELGVHLTELIERLQYPERSAGRCEMESTFDPIEPLPRYA
jgi:predicted dehydrogenase